MKYIKRVDSLEFIRSMNPAEMVIFGYTLYDMTEFQLSYIKLFLYKYIL